MNVKKSQDLDLPPELDADEQEIYDNLDRYETREMDENGIDQKAAAFCPPSIPLEADEQELYDNLGDYDTFEMDEHGRMVKLEPDHLQGKE